MNIFDLGFKTERALWHYLFNGGYFRVGIKHKEYILYKDDIDNHIYIELCIYHFDDNNKLIDTYRNRKNFADYFPIDIADIMQNYEIKEFI